MKEKLNIFHLSTYIVKFLISHITEEFQLFFKLLAMTEIKEYFRAVIAFPNRD